MTMMLTILTALPRYAFLPAKVNKCGAVDAEEEVEARLED
jgi:hypothetical protein